MLTRFQVKNFRSIVDLDLSFSFAEKRAPRGYKEMITMPFVEKGGVRGVPCLALYGANASGKSAILYALHAFLGLLRGDRCRKHYVPNRLHPELAAAETAMRLEWVDEKSRYACEVRYTRDALTYESFSVDGEELYSVTGATGDFSKLATQACPQDYLQQVFDVECARHLSAFLPVLVRRFPGLAPAATEAVEQLAAVQFSFGNKPPLRQAFNLLREACSDEAEEAAMREEALRWLQRLDLGIVRIDYVRVRRDDGVGEELLRAQERGAFPYESSLEPEEEPEDRVYTWRRNTEGKLVRFRLEEESLGTQVLVPLCLLMLAVLKQGGVLLVDEIDRSLHPLLVENLVAAFKDREENPKGAQLIFTIQAADLLDMGLLGVSEVGIVSKTDARGTDVARLADFRDAQGNSQRITDYRRSYLAGVLGGIPFPY